jgi:hypothetical protein
LASKLLSRKVKKGLQMLLAVEGWNIGVVHEPISAFLKPGYIPTVQWLPDPQPTKYLADPFVIVKDRRPFIFCEEFYYAKRRGRIISFELRGDIPSKPTVEIELADHIAYPYLVEWQGNYYCIPETCQANEIGLYKAYDFPHGWRKISTLIDDFAGIDPTLFQYDGCWWLTCTNKDDAPFESQKLYVWCAEDILGPWRPHAMNPVKTDSVSSRPAGTPFVHDGQLYRPAQDCSGPYGGAVVLNRIVKLTKTEYEEQQMVRIMPTDSFYSDGLHTVSSFENITVIDGNRKRVVKTSSQLKYKRLGLSQNRNLIADRP